MARPKKPVYRMVIETKDYEAATTINKLALAQGKKLLKYSFNEKKVEK